MGNVLGRILRLSTFGESHGPAVGCILDGLPSGLPVVVADIQRDLDRRRPGQNKLTTQRKEADEIEILSGVFQGCATGTPLAMLVRNTDQRSGDYSEMEKLYRPSHADLAYDLKYGFRDHRGGGRSSVRESIARVAAGALAKRLLREVAGTRILAWVESVETVDAHVDPLPSPRKPSRRAWCAAPIRKRPRPWRPPSCAPAATATPWAEWCGCGFTQPPVGIGEPVFDRLEAELAKAMLSIPATKGFEIGSGFAGSRLRGSAHNDPLAARDGRPVLTKNDSGGVQGGISVGASIDARIAFKPTATIASPQQTLDRDYHEAVLAARGRHDPCVVARAVPIVEAMAALVLADAYLLQRARGGLFPPPRREELP
jgi:chorismate synthase